MSVILIVNGMEKSKDCDSCWVPSEYCDLWLKYDVDVGCRHPDCPLHPLPEKHGRIVDVGPLEVVAYSLSDHKGESFDDGVEFILEKLDALPTIVEEEGD